MKPETEIDETGSFGEPEEKPAPFWKRSVWGISVATWGLCAVVLLAAIWYLLLRYKPEDIPVLRDNFNVPEFMLKRFLKMPEGPAPDGSGVPVLGVFRVKSGTLARILKFTVGPLELWALNSSPKDSALRKTLTNKLGSVRARKILAENFPRGSATSLIEHRAGQHNSDNVIEELASELIRKQGYNL